MQSKATAFRKYKWPRERLAAQGVANLKDEELLALIIRTGGKGNNVLALSASILQRQSLVDWAKVELSEWLQIKGLDMAKAAALVAAFELSARAETRRLLPLPIIASPSAAAPYFQHLRDKRKEYFCALYLNARHELLHQEVLSIGLVDRSLVHPREVFAPALAHRASAIIIGHNHPSGSNQPSAEDLTVTSSLIAAARLLQLSLLDHLIITATDQLSMREWGMPELCTGNSQPTLTGETAEKCVY